MRDLNISAAQGYRIERQTRDDRPARGGHLQAELIVPSRLAVVDDGGAERMFPYVVERRFADEHPRVAEYRERLHGVALELHLSPRWMLHPQPIGLDGEEIETVCELKGLPLRRTYG